MKNFVIVHLLVPALLMSVYEHTSAQDYLLTTRGDSITGEIKPMMYGPEKKVQVLSADKKKTTYSIFQIRSFSSEGEIYHPIKSDNGYVFMKLIKAGYLSLYAYQLENQSRFDGLFLKRWMEKRFRCQTSALKNI